MKIILHNKTSRSHMSQGQTQDENFHLLKTLKLYTKDVRFLKIAHFENFLEINDLDKNFYGNSHCVNAFQA